MSNEKKTIAFLSIILIICSICLIAGSINHTMERRQLESQVVTDEPSPITVNVFIPDGAEDKTIVVSDDDLYEDGSVTISVTNTEE